MPETRSNQDLIEESVARRAQIRADRGFNDSDATLRERATRAVEALERNTANARSDNEAPETVRERARNAVDPVLQARLDAQDRDFAEMNRELRTVRNALLLRNGGNDASDERRAKPEYQAYRAAMRDWMRGRVKDDTVEAAIRPAFQARAITSDDTSGGFLVPFELETQIERVLTTVCAMRSLATTRGMTTAVYKKPFNVGGAAGGWVAEKDTRPETSTSKLVMMEFPAFEYYAMPAASQTMFDDASFDVESWLAEEISIIATESEGDAFINGDGVVKPRGFLSYTIAANLNYPTKDTTTPSTFAQVGYVPTGVAAALTDSTHNGEDALLDLYHALRPGYRNDPSVAWLLSDSTLAQVRKFKDSYGQYLLAQPMGTADQPPRLLGKPVEVDENMPAVAANSYSIAFAAWKSAYLVADRVGMRLLRDPYSSKPYVLFYNTRRVGGGIQNFEAIKLLKTAAS
jgi:HK97 family phage major capsid protein